VYAGLEAETLSAAQLSYAQKHLRILSGLYEVLRPLDLMQPYRLEMGLKFENSEGQNLYEYWGSELAKSLNKQVRKTGTGVLLNLASNEYFKAVDKSVLQADIVTPVFRDLKNDKYKVISFFAKKARGQMARYVIEREINAIAALKRYRVAGYRYSAAESSANELVFLRDEAPA
ncbi:MAG: peroxide stress protein YaaA, partial [Pseudomonadota bacterium]